MNGPSIPSSSPPALNLTAAAALVAVLDLGLSRTCARLLLPHNGLSSGQNETLMTLGTFVSLLSGFLALALLVMALANAENRRQLFPRTLSVSLIFISAVFILLCGRTLIGPVGDRPLLYIKVAYGFLSLFITIGLWRGTTGRAPRRRWAMGISLFAAAGMLAMTASFIDRATSLSADIATNINRAGEMIFVLAAAATALLLAPRRKDLQRPGWFAGAAAAAVVAMAAMFAALRLRLDLLQTIAAYGFNMDVPTWSTTGNSLHLLLLSLATGSVAFTCVSFMGTRGAWRLLAYGLVLILAGGYQPSRPGLLAISLVGMFAMAAAVSRFEGALASTKDERYH